MPTPHEVSDLFDSQRHEPLTSTPWSEHAARAAIERICAAAEHEFDEGEGSWLMHPQAEPRVSSDGRRCCSEPLTRFW